jgi:cell division protein FtsN
MRAMKRLSTAIALLISACGPSYGGQDVKTPDQLVEEQDQLEQADQKNKKARGADETYSSEETDSEKKREFDRKQTKMELQRATRSAETCPGVVAEQEKKGEHPRGETKVSISFQEDGTVRQVSIPSPFDGTPLGECVIRAYKAVIVPPYVGGEQIVDWDVSLKDAPKTADKGKKK